ncbi:MAG TPA: hypothetical protein VMZ69_04920 [Saprospiraceae bacterium]|nr:hypothetical protein [Saprospiraceae bacterium]
MVKLIKYFFLFSLLTFISCVKDKIEDPAIDSSREYFPLKVGKYITYSVDSIVIDDDSGGNRKDTVHFELREEISGFQLSNEDTVFYIHRFRKNDSLSNWNLTDVWTTRFTINEALRTEENLTFRKMVFPLKDGKKWIGTSYINPLTTVLIGTENVQAFQLWSAEVKEFDIADQVGSYSFDTGNVMHISQTDTDDITSYKRYVMEKYVRGIGLVHRIDTILDSKCLNLPDISPCIGVPWLDHASKGYILSQVMIDHN